MSSLIAGVRMFAGVFCIKVGVGISYMYGGVKYHMSTSLAWTCDDYRKQYAQRTAQGRDDYRKSKMYETVDLDKFVAAETRILNTIKKTF